MARVRATIVVEYEANSEHYGGATDEQMVHQDREGLEEGQFGLEDLIEWSENEPKVTFELVDKTV